MDSSVRSDQQWIFPDPLGDKDAIACLEKHGWTARRNVGYFDIADVDTNRDLPGGRRKLWSVWHGEFHEYPLGVGLTLGEALARAEHDYDWQTRYAEALRKDVHGY